MTLATWSALRTLPSFLVPQVLLAQESGAAQSVTEYAVATPGLKVSTAAQGVATAAQNKHSAQIGPATDHLGMIPGHLCHKAGAVRISNCTRMTW
jgi:hypothetical protein